MCDQEPETCDHLLAKLQLRQGNLVERAQLDELRLCFPSESEHFAGLVGELQKITNQGTTKGFRHALHAGHLVAVEGAGQPAV